MLFLRVYVDPAEVDVVTRFLSVTAGVRHVARSDGVTEADEAVVTADVEVIAADAVLEGLVREGVHARDLYFVKMDTIDPLEASRTQWFGGDTIAWTDIVGIARANARPAARYLASMAAAGTIAAVGVSTSNEILVVGAMAVSPDLLPLSAMCVGLVGDRREDAQHLVARRPPKTRNPQDRSARRRGAHGFLGRWSVLGASPASCQSGHADRSRFARLDAVRS